MSSGIHFGVLCPALSGHLNPMITLGRELKRRGHRVTLFQIPDVQKKIVKEGLEYWEIGASRFPKDSLNRFLTDLGKRKGLDTLHFWHKQQQNVTGMICRDAPQAIKDAGVEALLIDQLEPAGRAVAEYLGIPFVTVCNALALNREPGIPPIFTHWLYRKDRWAHLRNRIINHLGDLAIRRYNVELTRYRQEWGLPTLKSPEILFANSTLAQISQQTADFDFPRKALPGCFHYTGPFRDSSPSETSFPFERLTGQPLIFASLGTLQTSKQEIFRCMAAACEGLDVQLVIAHGGGMSDRAARALPGSPLTVEFAPQRELMARPSASLTITHGGLNTVLDSLSHGVPLVVIPITFEQPTIAARVKWTGAGERIPAARLTVSRLRTMVQRVLMKPSYKANAIRLQESIQKAGGVERAADIAEQAIAAGKPILRVG